MKTEIRNFYKYFICKLFAVVLLCVVNGSFANAAVSNAAVSNGCENDDNSYINPMLALCNTHVYNIGGVENVDTAMERELMNEVVAIKTTVITQQMKKQYDFLDATVRRLKTQLEKSVLQAKLEANGAQTDSGNNKNIVAQFENCSSYGLEQAAYCFQRNINKYETYISEKKINKSVFSQMETDCNLLELKLSKNTQETKCGICKDIKNTQTTINNCMNILRSYVASINDEVDKRKYATPRR